MRCPLKQNTCDLVMSMMMIIISSRLDDSLRILRRFENSSAQMMNRAMRANWFTHESLRRRIYYKAHTSQQLNCVDEYPDKAESMVDFNILTGLQLGDNVLHTHVTAHQHNTTNNKMQQQTPQARQVHNDLPLASVFPWIRWLSLRRS